MAGHTDVRCPTRRSTPLPGPPSRVTAFLPWSAGFGTAARNLQAMCVTCGTEAPTRLRDAVTLAQAGCVRAVAGSRRIAAPERSLRGTERTGIGTRRTGPRRAPGADMRLTLLDPTNIPPLCVCQSCPLSHPSVHPRPARNRQDWACLSRTGAVRRLLRDPGPVGGRPTRGRPRRAPSRPSPRRSGPARWVRHPR